MESPEIKQMQKDARVEWLIAQTALLKAKTKVFEAALEREKESGEP